MTAAQLSIVLLPNETPLKVRIPATAEISNKHWYKNRLGEEFTVIKTTCAAMVGKRICKNYPVLLLAEKIHNLSALIEIFHCEPVNEIA